MKGVRSEKSVMKGGGDRTKRCPSPEDRPSQGLKSAGEPEPRSGRTERVRERTRSYN